MPAATYTRTPIVHDAIDTQTTFADTNRDTILFTLEADEYAIIHFVYSNQTGGSLNLSLGFSATNAVPSSLANDTLFYETVATATVINRGPFYIPPGKTLWAGSGSTSANQKIMVKGVIFKNG